MNENICQKIKCPQCQSDSSLQIIYGLPTTDLFLKAKQGKVFLGGWRFRPKNRHCTDCGYDWVDLTTPLEITEY